MVYRKEMAVSQNNMWLKVSFMTVISASSLLLRLAVPNLTTTQSNISALKDAVTA